MRTSSRLSKGSSLQAQPFPLDTLILDRDACVPLRRQLYGQLRSMIMRGTLRPETLLPSTRALSLDVGVARNTVIAAYEQLQAEGYLTMHGGARAVVADLHVPDRPDDAPASATTAEALSRRGRLMIGQPRHASLPNYPAFHPGTPDIARFPFAIWRRLLLRGLSPGGEDLFGYHSLTGHAGLRAAIAGYLEASRGVRCSPQQIVVTTGAQAALDLLARLLLDPGDGVWMEEPGYLGAQSAFLAAGARLCPLRVDATGWQIGSDAPKVRLIYLTPSCQFPLGVTMRMEQRLRLLEVARQARAWIVEDDFDSEYRFGGEPIPAMQGADRTGRVIYVGTFAKTLFPSLRLGFMVVPVALAARIDRAVNVTGQYPPLLLQSALAAFIDEGHFARHLRRMRRLYARRRGVFLQQCRERFAGVLTPLPSNAGIQVACWLNPRISDRMLAEAARPRQLNLVALSDHYRAGAAGNGLVLGYAALDAAATRAGLQTLTEVLVDLPGFKERAA